MESVQGAEGQYKALHSEQTEQFSLDERDSPKPKSVDADDDASDAGPEERLRP
jgi:hypothetical protein